ncbi:D-alanyl-D-alanine carboxypeptidase/D-alanyl-D-alanine endopeptidase [Dyadobacter chenhuakuii]|uniref:D-alanyl-D-alanine carboxypeptidase/D-alanyl-D-alanine-endopeptidase n=1 Tax=Dyadobacter chenhuakuii TaxID=2909339 RepID=A0ABY4XS76_9BACT|nr:D-alanyl-D-alanine carboxypeptidase/D-alanyl-D-alanine-endopeptidase [Dyadobacter chenhuakuii]MCF2492465.1 D-alanyl-D-alanine carboxypeptidase/D-alanyl-D-alanine-endopeptidase [Dyadobacter chenhuakuii]USJ33235.1 D-alanyl-D-alanine carboxypeptidase/D-alanyl-D-alanine-endopeptidase [Dyadobacter chenhuakuii]
MKSGLFLFFLFFCLNANAQNIDSIALNNLRDAVLELENSELMRSGSLSLSVKKVKDASNVFALNTERSLPSASTLKLVSTATALAVFGGDFKFQTFLEHDGIIRNDTLIGNVYIHGTGDPSLGSERFKGYPTANEVITRWVAAVKKTGVRYIKGSIIPDASFFDAETVASTWIWGDLGNYYGAGVSGLNFNENLYKIKFKPGADFGDPTTFVGIEPAIPYLTFVNKVTTGEKGSGDKTIVYSSPLGNEVVLTGTIPAGPAVFTVKGSIPNAAEYVAFALKNSLLNAAIGIGENKVPQPGMPAAFANPKVVLDKYESPPLRDLCQQTNFWSVNLYADALFKQAGKRLAGNAAFDDAAKAITAYWSGKGADLRGFYIKDGSGLSPSGSITTHSLTDILNVANKDASFNDFYKSIAVLGLNGTVRNLGKGTKAAGNMHVKSGSIEGTRAYAGYVTSKSGSLLSFSIIAHKYMPGSNRMISDSLVKIMTLMAEL